MSTPQQDTPEPQKPAAAPQTPDVAELGKPASGWSTKFTKVVATLTAIGAVASIAIGAAALIRRGKATEIAMDMIQDMTPEAAKTAATIFGGSNLVTGAVGALGAKAMWDSAASAARTRNFIKLHEQVNGAAQGAAR